MKLPISIAFIFAFTIHAFCNDGVYLTRGSVIYPINETRVSLDKEVLSFTVREKICRVDIYFEFNNPDLVERNLLIGFQAPMAYGDVPEGASQTNQISDFTILSNDQIVPYTLKVAECEDCELKEIKDGNLPEIEFPGVFVYLFQLSFKPGINKINHSYTFPASTNVEASQLYNYILTTGSKWANGTIKDLTVQIDMGDNTYFYVNDVFGDKADWSVIGTGKVMDKKQLYGPDPVRVARLLSGKLQINVKGFKPLKNIEFGINRRLNDDFLNTEEYTLDGNYSRADLKLLRNTIYAQHGHVFRSKEIMDYFLKFEWYIPNPNLTMDQIILTEKEKKLLDEIIKREKE